MKIKKKLSMIAAFVAILFPASSTFAYTAHSGDSMWRIAVSHQLTLEQLENMNPQLKDPKHILIGQNINIDNKKTLSDADHKLLGQLVHAEACGEPYKGKVKVAKVVLNRVASSKFPDTIKDVIYQPHQFQPVENGAIKNTPTDSDYKAVDEAMASGNQQDGSLYFYNPAISTKSSWLSTLPTTAVIGHHVFKR